MGPLSLETSGLLNIYRAEVQRLINSALKNPYVGAVRGLHDLVGTVVRVRGPGILEIAAPSEGGATPRTETIVIAPNTITGEETAFPTSVYEEAALNVLNELMRNDYLVHFSPSHVEPFGQHMSPNVESGDLLSLCLNSKAPLTSNDGLDEASKRSERSEETLKELQGMVKPSGSI